MSEQIKATHVGRWANAWTLFAQEPTCYRQCNINGEPLAHVAYAFAKSDGHCLAEGYGPLDLTTLRRILQPGEVVADEAMLREVAEKAVKWALQTLLDAYHNTRHYYPGDAAHLRDHIPSDLVSRLGIPELSPVAPASEPARQPEAPTVEQRLDSLQGALNTLVVESVNRDKRLAAIEAHNRRVREALADEKGGA